MEIDKIPAPAGAPLERIYIVMAILANFRWQKHVEAHFFRAGADDAELELLRGLNLVGDPDPETPEELLAGATEDAALRCVLEAFTEQESDQLVAYLQDRYGDQIEKLVVCPLQMPVPLGVGPLASIPESKKAGFINFDLARDYPLPFRVRAYYELE